MALNRPYRYSFMLPVMNECTAFDLIMKLGLGSKDARNMKNKSINPVGRHAPLWRANI